ncbi:unnamed protein product [Paramecium sonneborni]|uniref:RNase III domain-containing protein n=1 Tax=Paramecium sonneborni TaxID=65129 RepID=A0A8S1QEP1_9CILI|nr:unnamed protein product [Paramecium sonneborni]
MQAIQEDHSNLRTLLEFQYSDLYHKAMTFKNYHIEYTARNKDNPLKYGNNENFIELGMDLIEFYFIEFFTYQNLPNKDHKTFSTYTEIKKQKQVLLSDQNLAEVTIQLGLKDEMHLAINSSKELKNNPKIQAQALKAVIGAQYFDKQKDLNLLRKLLKVLYQYLIKKSLDESMSFVKLENFKGDFKEFMDKHPEYSYKLNYQEFRDTLDANKKKYEYELVINDVIPIKRSGDQKKPVERKVFQDSMLLLKMDQFKQLLDDSIKSQLSQSFTGVSMAFQKSSIIESNIQSEIHNKLYFIERLGQLEQNLKSQNVEKPQNRMDLAKL